MFEKLFALIQHYQSLLDPASPWSWVIGLCVLVLVATIANFVVKRVLVGAVTHLLRYTPIGQDEKSLHDGVVPRLANVVPALVIIGGIHLVPGLPDLLVRVVYNVSSAFIILMVARAISAALNTVNALYQRRSISAVHPIKGYIQVIKIALFAVAAILMIAALIDKSPVILLSGLGAMAAVLMLVFQDTLLSLVASVQISSSDMVRVGDWIEMPQLNADGDVIDIALHTVKVQNWDKTITTLPTRRLISDPFKNWRGMQESGGRRIKRAIYLDQSSIHFLDSDAVDRLGKFRSLKDYLSRKDRELEEWNGAIGERGEDPVNARRLTNIGTFRAYVEHYLRAHPRVHQGMTILVRQLAPGAEGLPLEMYCFTNTVAWAEYESIQSDIFDHLYAILPLFGLRAFQNPAGYDMQLLASR